MFLLVFLTAFLVPYTLFNVSTLEAEPAAAHATAARATITIRTTRPLTVVGRGFKSRESVRVTAGRAVRRTTATPTGTFTARFSGVARCGVGTIVATGARGSRAMLNVSSLLCLD